MKEILGYIDPTGHYLELGRPQDELVYLLGDMPGLLDESDDQPLYLQVEKKHSSFTSWRSKKAPVIDEDGLYKYRGEAVRYPVAMFTRGDERMFIYTAGIIGYVSPEYPTGIDTRVD